MSNERRAETTTRPPPTTPTTSSSARAPAAARWRRGWPKPASRCCCSKPAAIRAHSIGDNAADAGTSTACPTTTTCRRSMRSSTENAGDALGLLRPALRRRRAAAAGPELPRRRRRQAGGRRALSARGDTRRLHRAQRDDPASTRTTPTGTSSPISPAIRRGVPNACARTSSGSRRCEHRPDERALARLGVESEPARLVRMAADRDGRPGCGLKDRDLRKTILESARAALPAPRSRITDADRRARLDSAARSQRLARRRRGRDRRALYAADDARITRASARASVCSTWRSAIPTG